jgi:hypothetical protein
MERRTAIILNLLKTLAILGALALSIQFLIQLNSVKDHAGGVRGMAKLAHPQDSSLLYKRSITMEKKLGDLEIRFFWTTSILGALAFSPWARTREIEIT